jgi:lysine decarboxylase
MTYLPLKSALAKYAESSPARFHMPGHKGFLSAFDVTEITGTDNLHEPSGAILESEKLCAKALCAREAFFSVNGSTAANLAMLHLAGRGARILLGRDCHKSAINGIALSEQEVFPLYPSENGAYSAEAVERVLVETGCGAVFITSPTYRGVVSDIGAIADAAHRHGALLLVDAAHGAHFAYSEALPPVPSKADLWCVSAHKTLKALTQTALLLTGESCPFTAAEVQKAISLFTSTSPFYELMLSIESAVLEPSDWDAHAKRINDFSNRIKGIKGIGLIEPADAVYDITRLNIAAAGMTGHALGKHLESRGIFCEMADGECVTLITSPEDPDEWYERLIAALEMLDIDIEYAADPHPAVSPELMGRRVISVRDAIMGNTQLVRLEEAEGRVCAGAVGCYPPGCAILFPGETVTREAVLRLIRERESGAILFGLTDGLVPVVWEEQ